MSLYNSSIICYVCEEEITDTYTNHPLLGPRHVNCGKKDKVCNVCHMALPCECD